MLMNSPYKGDALSKRIKLQVGCPKQNSNGVSNVLPICLSQKELAALRIDQDDKSNRSIKALPFTQRKGIPQLIPSKKDYCKPEKNFSVKHNQNNIESKAEHNRRYYPPSSFELKLGKELERLSQAYMKDDLRKLFHKRDTLSSLFQLNPNYELYKNVKCIENRYSGMNFKSKLLPISYKAKDNINKLAERFYHRSCYSLLNQLVRKKAPKEEEDIKRLHS